MARGLKARFYKNGYHETNVMREEELCMDSRFFFKKGNYFFTKK